VACGLPVGAEAHGRAGAVSLGVREQGSWYSGPVLSFPCSLGTPDRSRRRYETSSLVSRGGPVSISRFPVFWRRRRQRQPETQDASTQASKNRKRRQSSMREERAESRVQSAEFKLQSALQTADWGTGWGLAGDCREQRAEQGHLPPSRERESSPGGQPSCCYWRWYQSRS
jgi:hypothetical protein